MKSKPLKGKHISGLSLICDSGTRWEVKLSTFKVIERRKTLEVETYASKRVHSFWESSKTGLVMDHTVSRDRDHVVDVESGGGSSNSEEEGLNDQVPRISQVQNFLGRVWNGVKKSDGLVKGEDDGNSSYHNVGSNGVDVENAEFMADKKLGGEETEGPLEQSVMKEKRKKTSPKRPSKPPRPPRGPSLDAADQKLIKEISEIIMLKRARNERIKAMKKMKAAKSSSNNGLCAMIITIVFLLLFILFPGRSNSSANFSGSPEPSRATRGGLISVQFYKNNSARGSNGAGSSTPSYIEQVSGFNPPRKREALMDEVVYSRKGQVK